MMQAIGKNGKAYLIAMGGLESDYNITLAAFGSDASDWLMEFFISTENDDGITYLHPFLHKVQEKLTMHDAFIKGLLCGMSEFFSSECKLPLLQQGTETLLALKKLVSEYIDIPPGNEVPLLH